MYKNHLTSIRENNIIRYFHIEFVIELNYKETDIVSCLKFSCLQFLCIMKQIHISRYSIYIIYFPVDYLLLETLPWYVLPQTNHLYIHQ